MAGLLNIWGTQYNTPGGGVYNDGPFAIPYSATYEAVLCPQGVTTTVPVPAAPNTPAGVIILGTVASVAFSAGFIVGQLTRFSASAYPVIWPFDPLSIPANVIVTVGAAAGALVTVRFF